jgi:hypothetical protein
MRRAVLALASAILLSLLLAASAAASPSLPVTIDLYQELDESGQGFVPSPFYATGPAVEAGLVCPQGMAHNLTEPVSGPGGLKDKYLQIYHTTKLFECDDHSGSFIIKLEHHLVITFTPDSVTWDQKAPWRIAEGTGNYVRLHGTGSATSLPYNPEGSVMHDHMTGWLHID